MSRTPTRLVLLVAAVAGLSAPAAAGEIVGFSGNRAAFDRFTSGFPDAPVRNTSAAFVGAGLDLSGLGWRAGDNFGVTLVSPQHFVTAAHVGLYGVNSQVRFLSADGVVRSYAVGTVTDAQGNVSARQTRLTTTFVDPTTGATRTLPSDLLVVALAAPVPAADGVRPVAVTADPIGPGRELLVASQNAAYGADTRQLGLNTLDGVALTTFDPAPNRFTTEATRVAVFDYTRTRAGDTALIGGDSGSALLTREGDTAVLLGTHYGVSGSLADPNSRYLSTSAYVPAYLDQLQSVVAADGQSLTFVPVPEPALTGVAAGAALAWAARRRRAAG